MNTKHSLMFVALGVLALAGCERRDNRRIGTDDQSMNRDLPPKGDQPLVGGQPAVGGGPLAIDDALNKIVEARCDREMRCGNVGADQKFADRNACVAQVKKDFADGINASDCPAGVDSKELDECLTDARKEDCNNPFDTIGRVAACRTSDICRHVK